MENYLQIFSFKDTGTKKIVSLFSRTETHEDIGEFDRLFVRPIEDIERPFGADKDLLLRNRGILSLQVPRQFILRSIDVYGVTAEDHLIHDEDFPDEDIVVSAEIDLLL